MVNTVLKQLTYDDLINLREVLLDDLKAFGSVSEIAKRTNIPKGTVSKIMNGKQLIGNTSLDTIAKLTLIYSEVMDVE